MRPTVRKLAVKDIGALEKLVADNVESIETGLKVIDTRLLLGQAAIDLVGLDEKGALVLIALDFTADEALLLRVMDAYSWCLEYPEAIHRLYPMATSPVQRPPRILFIVERLTDLFVRRIKQLSFLEMDCLEFRHLEVNGMSALYFDLVQRLRRAEAGEAAQGEPEACPPVIVDAPVVSAAALPPAAVTPPPAAVTPPAEEVAPTPEVSVETSQKVQRQELPSGPLASLANEWEKLLSQLDENPLAVEPVAADKAASPAAETAAAIAVESLAENPVEAAAVTLESGTVEEPRVEDAPVQEPQAPTPAPEPAVAPPPAWAKRPGKTEQPGVSRKYFFGQASKGTAPEGPEKAAPTSAPAPPASEAPAAPRPELESINFPKDGLSRQWLEFLNQLSPPK